MSRIFRRFRSRRHVALFEIFEPRVLLSGSYLAGDLTGDWRLGGLDKAGHLTFDGVLGVTAGSWSNQDGSADLQIVAGTGSIFSLGPTGIANVALETIPSGGTLSSFLSLQGAMNATKDLVALNQSVTGVPAFEGLNVLVQHTGTFGAGDLGGTWNIAAEDFRGSVTLNAAGHVTGGLLFLESNQKSAKITGGTATINADGTGTLALNTAFSGANAGFATVALDITMNTSKDVMVGNSSSIGMPASPAGTVPAELTVFSKTAGTYSSADVVGVTWTLSSALGFGTLTFHANKTVSGSLTSPEGTVAVLTGNFSLGGNGTLITNITATAGATVSHFSLTGAINRSRNLVAMDRAIANPGTNSSLTLLVSSANHAPVERAKGVLPQSAFQSSAVTIDYATIANVTSATDVDRDGLSFLITAVPAGALTITHNSVTNPVVAGTTVMQAGDTLTWTPADGAQGQINALNVKATDGTALAGVATKIFINTSPKAVVSAKATKGIALETKAGTHAGDGKIQIQRAGGDLTQALDVTLAVGGTAGQGVNYDLLGADGVTILASATPVVTIPAGQSSVTLTVTPLQDGATDQTLSVVVTVATGSLYTPSVHASGHVDIIDSSPLVTITPRTASIGEGEANVRTFFVERLPAQGGNVNGSLTVNLAYGGTFDTVHDLVAPASVTFAPGEVKKIVTLTTVDNQSANAAQTLTATISGAGFVTSGSATAVVHVLDAAPIISITRDRATALEAHPATAPAKFTIHRTGATTGALTVDFSTAAGGTFGTLGTNYTLADSSGNPLTSSVVIPAGKKAVTVTLTPIDDGANDPTLQPTITLQADAGPTYHLGGADQVTLNIINNDRRPVVANGTAVPTTPVNTALNLDYDALVSLMDATLAPGEVHGNLQLRITAKFAGTLQIIPSGAINAVAAPVGTLIETGDTLVWTPPANPPSATLKAFTLIAVDGTLVSSLSTRFSIAMP